MSKMNAVQENLFQLLVEFDEICKQYDIEYLLAAGASLGAVRNRCFMPWDDDIDLYITRDNWNKLRHILENEKDVLPKNRSFVYRENTPYYCNPLPRYVDDTTTTMFASQALAGKSCGQHIEIFIFDPMPQGEKEKQKYLELLHVYTELISPYFVVNKDASMKDWEKHYELYLYYCDRVDNEGEEQVLSELEEKLQQFTHEECDQYCMRWGIRDYIYDKELFEQEKYGIFEGKEFPIGKYPEKMLRVAYGDSWMYVPEYEEQVVHGGLKYADMSFHELTDRYMGKINRESVFESYKKNKRNNASVFHNREKFKMLSAKEKVIVESRHFIDKLNDNEDYLRSLLDEKDYSKISYEFGDYSKLQLSENVRRFNIFVPISDRNLATLLLSLIEQGKYYDVNKYLNIRKTQDKPLADYFKEIENLVDICRQISVARYDNKDKKLVESLIEEYGNEYSNLLDIHRARIWLLEQDASSSEDYENIDNVCEQVLALYPFDGEIMAMQAKSKLKKGEKEAAYQLYEKAIVNTRNGLVWQEVEDETGISRIDIEREMIEGVE